MFFGDQHEAEDVVQETFLTAHQRLESFRQGDNFGRWLRGIARNKVLEHCRSARRRAVVDSRIIEGMEVVYAVFDAPLLGEETWRERMTRWTQHCVERLSVNLRTAVIHVYQEGMSLQSAAAAEKVSTAAIAKRLSRARDLIRQCVQQQSEAGS
jgi:RNA polymerase sigma-70 factor (ECF subfamily)